MLILFIALAVFGVPALIFGLWALFDLWGNSDEPTDYFDALYDYPPEH